MARYGHPPYTDIVVRYLTSSAVVGGRGVGPVGPTPIVLSLTIIGPTA